eukprot:g16983.t1
MVPNIMMEVVLNVKAGFRLHKDCAMVTYIDTVMDRCNCSWQMSKDEVRAIPSRQYTTVLPPLLGLSCQWDRTYPEMVMVVSGTLSV